MDAGINTRQGERKREKEREKEREELRIWNVRQGIMEKENKILGTERCENIDTLYRNKIFNQMMPLSYFMTLLR